MTTARDRDDLCFMTITDLARAIEARDVSPVDVTQSLLDRINEHDDEMRAYITVTGDVALAQAREAETEIVKGNYRGHLHGIPFSLKDNIETKGIRTSCASMVNPDWMPSRDATVYANLRQAGGILAGKANLFEYAFSMNPAFPASINPWHPERSSSGSSSGSAVSVASGMAYASIGTDTGGSGRAPASVNGVVGLKGTYGRASRTGIVPLSYSLDHATAMARNVRDAALIFQEISGHDPLDDSSSRVAVPDFTSKIGQDITGMKVGVACGFTHESIDPDVVSVMASAVDALENLGAQIADLQLPFVQHCVPLQAAIMHAEAATVHYQAMREVPDKFGEAAFVRLDLGSTIPATAYIHAQQVRKAMRDAFREVFNEFDVIVSPTVPGRAGLAGTWTTVIDGKEVDIRAAGPEYTGIYNLVGIPAISVPAGFSSEGTPIGLQIAGSWFSETTILQVAHAFEQQAGFVGKRPPYLDPLT